MDGVSFAEIFREVFYLLEKLIKVEKARAGGKRRKKGRKKRLRQKEFILFAKCYVHFNAYIISILFVESRLIGIPKLVARCSVLSYRSICGSTRPTKRYTRKHTRVTTSSTRSSVTQFRNECGPVDKF